MTRAQSQGERIAVVEQKIDHVEESFRRHHEEMHDKIDRILEGQTRGAEDRAKLHASVATLAGTVEKMVPHVETIANAKTFWSWSAKFAAAATAVGAAGYSGYQFLKAYFQMKGH